MSIGNFKVEQTNTRTAARNCDELETALNWLMNHSSKVEHSLFYENSFVPHAETGSNLNDCSDLNGIIE